MVSERFGIHMGNSTVCLSILKDGKIDIIANKFGDRCSYAVVSANDDEFAIGLPAKQALVRNGPATIVNNFQFLNEMDPVEFEDAAKSCVCEVTNEDQSVEYNLTSNGTTTRITPYEVAVKLFANLYETASQASKADENLKAILSVPLYFTPASRKRLVSAANEAGFNIIQIVSEPASVLLAYEIGFQIDSQIEQNLNENVDSSGGNQHVLVYRLGGLSCDVTLVNCVNGLYECVDQIRLGNCGGNLLTNALADYIAIEFYQKFKLDPRESRRTMVKIRQHAENSKHILSNLTSVHLFIESLMDGVDWSQHISRARFENIIAPNLPQFLRPLEQLMNKWNHLKIDTVILCGGSMKIPKLKTLIASILPNSTILSQIPGDEVISIGCARQTSFCDEVMESIGDNLDMEISTISSNIWIEQTMDNDNMAEKIVEKKLLFRQGSPVPNETNFIVKKINGKIAFVVRQQQQKPSEINEILLNVDRQVSTMLDDVEIRFKIHSGHANKTHPILDIIFEVQQNSIN